MGELFTGTGKQAPLKHGPSGTRTGLRNRQGNWQRRGKLDEVTRSNVRKILDTT